MQRPAWIKPGIFIGGDMQLTPEDVRKVASLARLRVSDAEVASLTSDLTAILGYVDVLNELDTTNVEPMVHAVELSNVLRADTVVESLPRAAALSNAPRSDGQYFLVPAIIELRMTATLDNVTAAGQ